MGYNLSGIVINKNLHTHTEALSQILGLHLVFARETDTAGATTEEQTADFINVYFSGSGTLILAHQDLCLDRHYAHPATQILTFALSETAMAFYFEYTENQKTVRSKMEVEGLVIEEHGKPLNIEDQAMDTSEVIWEQLAQVLGQKFDEIQPGATWTRYTIRPAITIPDEPAAAYQEAQSPATDQETIEVPGTLPPNKSAIFLLGMIAGCLLLVAGLVYAIYSIFTLS